MSYYLDVWQLFSVITKFYVVHFRHPDNFSSNNHNESEKKLAEKKFIDIAAAKEVLTDPEKRAEFDQGEDILLR